MLVEAHDLAGFPDIGETVGRLLDVRPQSIHQRADMGGAGMTGDTVEQARGLIGPGAESRGRRHVAVGNEIAGKDLEIRGAPFQGSGQDHEIAVGAEFVRGIVPAGGRPVKTAPWSRRPLQAPPGSASPLFWFRSIAATEISARPHIVIGSNIHYCHVVRSIIPCIAIEFDMSIHNPITRKSHYCLL